MGQATGAVKAEVKSAAAASTDNAVSATPAKKPWWKFW